MGRAPHRQNVEPYIALHLRRHTAKDTLRPAEVAAVVVPEITRYT